MTDVTHGESADDRPPMTQDEVAEKIVETMNLIAGLPDELTIVKRLAATWTVHLDQNGTFDIPRWTADLSFLQAIVQLEARIAKIEQALRGAGIAVDKLTPFPD